MTRPSRDRRQATAASPRGHRLSCRRRPPLPSRPLCYPRRRPARPASEAEEFGLSERQRAAREPQPEKPPATAVTAAVTAVRKLPTGYLRIDLDNDQAWQQTETDPNIRLRTGDRVTIRKAALGSFLLETPGRFSTRVRRVK